MKPVIAIARVFLDARVGVLDSDRRWQKKVAAGLASGPRPLNYFDGLMHALAYVMDLDLDLDQMNAPKLAGQVEPFDEVRVSWIDAYGCFFVEFPPDEMQYRQEYRAEFLSLRQARQLLDELNGYITAQAHLTAVEFAHYVREEEAKRARRRELGVVHSPTQPSDPGRAGALVRLSAVRASRARADVAYESEQPKGPGGAA